MHSSRCSDKYASNPNFFIDINIVFSYKCNGFVPTRRCSVLGSRVVAAPRLARLINKRLLGKYYVTSRGVFWASAAQAAVAVRWSAAFGHSSWVMGRISLSTRNQISSPLSHLITQHNEQIFFFQVWSFNPSVESVVRAWNVCIG